MSNHRELDACRCGERPRSLRQIAARRRELVERSAAQRGALARHTAGLSPAFAAGDKILGVGRSLLSHPFLLAGAGVLMLVLLPRASFGLFKRGFALLSRG
ncbi:MAG: YqjK family protein [Anaeromyxobacteraceae bacterium]